MFKKVRDRISDRISDWATAKVFEFKVVYRNEHYQVYETLFCHVVLPVGTDPLTASDQDVARLGGLDQIVSPLYKKGLALAIKRCDEFAQRHAVKHPSFTCND